MGLITNTSNLSLQKTRFVSVTVISALLGSHAMELGSLVILYYDYFTGSGLPQKKYQVEFGLLILAFGFIVLTALEVLKARKSNEKADFEAVASAVIVGLIGGLFSIIGNTADNDGYLTSDTIVAAFYLCALGLVFVLPIAVSRWNKMELRETANLFLTLSIAGGFAFLSTGVAQLFITTIGEFCNNGACGHQLQSLHFNPYATSFFLSSPMAAALYAPWALLAVDPINQPKRWLGKSKFWRVRWLLLSILMMLALVIVYALAMYWPKHSVSPNGWLYQYSVSKLTVLIYFLLLQLCIVLFVAGALLRLACRYQSRIGLRCDVAWLLFAFAFGTLLASVVVVLLPSAEMKGWFKIALFIIPQGLTCSLALLGCLLGLRYAGRSEA